MDTRSTQQSRHINSLPTEVLLQVFSYLRPAYLIQTVSKVCTIWEGLSEDPCLYKTVEFKGDEISLEASIKLLKLAPLLEALTLVDVEDLDIIVCEVSQHNHKIRSLVLEVKKFRSLGLHMMQTIKNFTNLQTLILHGCYVCDTKVYISVFCMKLPHLKTLHLDRVANSGSGIAAQLANCCFELEDLQIYDITHRRIYITKECIIALCSRFQKSLCSLRLGGAEWSQEAFCALLKCERLETLGICWPTTIIDGNVMTISLIPNLRRLELFLVRPNLLPAKVIQLFTSGGLTNLVSLYVWSYIITDEVAAAIGDHLKNLQIFSLQEKEYSFLRNIELTRVGVKNVIKGCFRLLELNLNFFGAEDDVKKVLLLIPEYLPGLKKLILFPFRPNYEFHETETRKAVAQIKKRMPDLQLKLITQ